LAAAIFSDYQCRVPDLVKISMAFISGGFSHQMDVFDWARFHYTVGKWVVSTESTSLANLHMFLYHHDTLTLPRSKTKKLVARDWSD
jgi:hypothetical protein